MAYRASSSVTGDSKSIGHPDVAWSQRKVDLANRFDKSRERFEQWIETATRQKSDISSQGREYLQRVKDCFSKTRYIDHSRVSMNGKDTLRNETLAQDQTKVLAELTAECVDLLAITGRTGRGSTRMSEDERLPHLLHGMIDSYQSYIDRGTQAEADSAFDLFARTGNSLSQNRASSCERAALQALEDFKQLTSNKSSGDHRDIYQIDKAFIGSIPYQMAKHSREFDSYVYLKSEDAHGLVRQLASRLMPLTRLWKEAQTQSGVNRELIPSIPWIAQEALCVKDPSTVTRLKSALSDLNNWKRNANPSSRLLPSFPALASSIDAVSPDHVNLDPSTESWTFGPDQRASLGRLTNEVINHLSQTGELFSRADRCPGLSFALQRFMKEYKNCCDQADRRGDGGSTFARTLVQPGNTLDEKQAKLDEEAASRALSRFMKLTEDKFIPENLPEIDRQYLDSVPYYLHQVMPTDRTVDPGDIRRAASQFRVLATRWKDAHEYADRFVY
ncbi:hypothetical protein I302_103107 [Kwoniella bestiolae CBS 10118]|uniref:Uncharacterized protein n=1 Tax=Kwoniella bestiolae CBS 10118 TaxID=1296100 RepID=A0A1B9GGZ4_9TREE|nr:hypothetical protein I302_01807 [Kwoniella bestiolae CBS 10118]OCF30288.1 hypothetical protein I302_01807 [Kwoniella bestiolae CBS 10118]